MNTWKQNCESHAILRFEERFDKEDFVYKTKKLGVVDFKNEIINAIINAPIAGKWVKGGKGTRNIYKIKYGETKPVFVVWDMALNCIVTVLTEEMKNVTKISKCDIFTS